MASVNKVILLGNLGDKPEIKYTTNNKTITVSLSAHSLIVSNESSPCANTYSQDNQGGL